MFNKRATALAVTMTTCHCLTAVAGGSNPVTSDSVTNTAMGSFALQDNFNSSTNTGYQNTAAGFGAMQANTFGFKNAAFGYEALPLNQTGWFNTAIGSGSLNQIVSGNSNTAIGADALYHTIASSGTAVGTQALYSNYDGYENTALGAEALYANYDGQLNLALGAVTLPLNTHGSSNTAVGSGAMHANVLGNYNTAVGTESLEWSTGDNNIAIGNAAAANITIGSNNIDIGSAGVSGDADTVRIGGSLQKKAFMSGVYGVSVGKSELPVYMNSSGQLGTLNSSRRYKTGIASMRSTEKLDALRPVTFHLKSDPNGPLQYGLIAEEVDKVFPDLVVRDQSGRIASVRYDELAPILLRQIQLDHQRMQQDHAALVEMQRQLSVVQAAMVQGGSSLVAQR